MNIRFKKSFLGWYRLYVYPGTEKPDRSSPTIWNRLIYYLLCLKFSGRMTSSVDPDHTPRSAHLKRVGPFYYLLYVDLSKNLLNEWKMCRSWPNAAFFSIWKGSVLFAQSNPFYSNHLLNERQIVQTPIIRRVFTVCLFTDAVPNTLYKYARYLIIYVNTYGT